MPDCGMIFSFIYLFTFWGVASDTQSVSIYISVGISGGLPPIPSLLTLPANTLNVHWWINHDAFMHAFVISYVRTVLRVLSKYWPGLLIWSDVDEGYLMDEEFDSESDA